MVEAQLQVRTQRFPTAAHVLPTEPEPVMEPEPEPESEMVVEQQQVEFARVAAQGLKVKADPAEGFVVPQPACAPECPFDVTFSEPGQLGLSLVRAETGWTVVSRAIPGTQAAQHPDIAAGLLLLRVGSTVLDAETDYLSVLKLLSTDRRPLTMCFARQQEGGTHQSRQLAKDSNKPSQNAICATPETPHTPPQQVFGAGSPASTVESTSPVSAEIQVELMELQKAAGEAVKSANCHLLAEASEARRRDDLTRQQHRLHIDPRLSPLEREVLSASTKTPTSVDQKQDTAFDVGGIVREKMEIIQALRRELAERDAQLEHAGVIADKYTHAVRVAEMACAQLKELEAKLDASEAEVARLRAEAATARNSTETTAAGGDQPAMMNEKDAEGVAGGDSIDDVDVGDGQPESGPEPAAAVAARAAVVRCCLSCGHRNISDTHGDCGSCGIPLSRPCPSCGAEMKNGASMCLACFEIDNAHTAQPRPRDDMALQVWNAPTVFGTAGETVPRAR